MNLFVVAFGHDAESQRKLARELVRTARRYPHLDPSTVLLESRPGGVLIGSITSPPQVAAPRVAVSRRGDELVLLDGLPLDPTGSVDVHDARVWHGDWSALADRLEGRFVAVRVAGPGPAIEVLTDPAGIIQLYVHEAPGASVISNSAGLVARALDLGQLDETGAATFLSSDIMSGQHTLRAGVRVLDPAQSWTWTNGDRGWTKATYWHATRAVTGPGRDVDDGIVDDVVGGIAAVTRAAARVNGSLFAPITAGKDSRMLASVLMTHDVPATYWTKGDPASLDAIVAADIAERYGLRHILANRPTAPEAGAHTPTQSIAARWPELSASFVAQTDGIASLMNVGNIAGQPDRIERIEVTLTGLCGELARGASEHPQVIGVTSIQAFATFVAGQVVDHRRGLVTRDAFELARAYIRSTLTGLHARGVPLERLAKTWSATDRYHRWAAMNPVELAQTEDKVMPFMTRSFITAALSLRPDVRWREQLHRAVIRRLVPALETEPRLALPWTGPLPQRTVRDRARDWVRPRLPYRVRTAAAGVRDRRRPPVVYRSLTVPYDESAWLESNLTGIREIVLSQPSSDLWRVVNREKMERLLAPDTPAETRRLQEAPLFAALSMFQYEQIEREIRAESVAEPTIGSAA